MRVVSSLLGGVSSPRDFFAGGFAVYDGELGGEARGDRGGGAPAGAGGSRYVGAWFVCWRILLDVPAPGRAGMVWVSHIRFAP